ncbi:hypothetical protein [Streptomyces sp. NBC_01443]|uniref:hypothetical protein n=1 Tax=Streptomyces sp. NBC_01443 TaxID=2903868 RepID=UPI0022575428|nr:hypothetical protein [Streptomyces sp. NBC_01443]MCX4632816.1 hypothetical protein [Streptomyces sp. NBC_01443]
MSEQTLKRAILLYDEVLFIDPKTPKVRAGLYSVENHQPYLPDDAAYRLSQEWTEVANRYALLEREGVVRFVDPTPLLENSAVDAIITGGLQADMTDQGIINLFANHPPTWSILRSRIPPSAFSFLHHQYTPRVLYDGNTHHAFQVIERGDENGGKLPLAHALFADGRPDQQYSSPGYGLGSEPRTDDEYAAVVPYYLGSSLATSMALAIALENHAVPLTDSDAHFRLLSARFTRAAEGAHLATALPGLKPPTFTGSAAQKRQLVEQRLVDSILSPEDLAALSLEDCLRYRESTAGDRANYRAHLSAMVGRIRSEPWSQDIEAEIAQEIRQAEHAIEENAAAMRARYKALFGRTAISLSLTAAPALLTAVFPGVSALWALLLGAGALSGILVEPIKELAGLWSNTRDDVNGLAYLMNLR